MTLSYAYKSGYFSVFYCFLAFLLKKNSSLHADSHLLFFTGAAVQKGYLRTFGAQVEAAFCSSGAHVDFINTLVAYRHDRVAHLDAAAAVVPHHAGCQAVAHGYHHDIPFGLVEIRCFVGAIWLKVEHFILEVYNHIAQVQPI